MPKLTPSQRIAFNTLATYGRMLFSIIFSLFSSRWVVNGLGLSDFGLVGVVGALLVFISFFNTVLGGSVGRYYSYVIGKHNIEPNDKCEELTQWFNTALCVHTVVPLLLLVVGAPIGYYAIGHWLVIPETRVGSCYYVFSFSLITTFVNMVSIPYLSFFWSWQRFAEMVLWESVKTIFMFLFAYSIMFYDGDRLIYYAGYSMCTMSLFTFVQIVRARLNFAPCRFRPYMWGNRQQLKDLLSFSGWQLFGCAGGLLKNQGAAIIINLFYGAKINGSFNIANQLSAQTSSLSNSLVTALTPAVTSAEGAGSDQKVKTLALQACKFGTLLVLFFAIPLSIEIDEVLLLWLKQCPPYAAELCQCIIFAFVADKLTTGYMPAIMAKGKIALYQVVTGGVLLVTVPLIYVFAKLGFSPVSVGMAFVITAIGSSLSRLYFGYKLVGLSAFAWVKFILVPLIVGGGAAFAFGMVIAANMQQSLIRVIAVSAGTALVLSFMAWAIVLTSSEKEWVKVNMVRRLFR